MSRKQSNADEHRNALVAQCNQQAIINDMLSTGRVRRNTLPLATTKEDAAAELSKVVEELCKITCNLHGAFFGTTGNGKSTVGTTLLQALGSKESFESKRSLTSVTVSPITKTVSYGSLKVSLTDLPGSMDTRGVQCDVSQMRHVALALRNTQFHYVCLVFKATSRAQEWIEQQSMNVFKVTIPQPHSFFSAHLWNSSEVSHHYSCNPCRFVQLPRRGEVLLGTTEGLRI